MVRIPTSKFLKKIQDSGVTGFAEKLLMQSVITDRGEDFRITIPTDQRGFLNQQRADVIREALNLSKPISFGLSKNPLTDTPHEYMINNDSDKLAKAYQEIESDPVVQGLIRDFDAKILKVKAI